MEDRRQTDPVLIALDQRFRDFLERYERDQEYSQIWRMDIKKRLVEVEQFVTEFKPIHKKVVWIVSLIFAGSVAVFVKWFWAHVGWK